VPSQHDRRTPIERLDDRGSLGGRAGEIGSEYRAAIAAYLASYGLSGVDLPFEDEPLPGHPARLSLETGAAIDDIRCVMSTGSTWDIQAKSDGGRRSLMAAAQQWLKAVEAGEAAGDDRFVLIAGRLNGPVGKLSAAIKLRRLAPDAPQAAPLLHELTKFTRDLASFASVEQVELVLDRAMIIELDAATVDGAARREAAALLDATVVARRAGAAGIAALVAYFHREAPRSGSGCEDQWLAALDQATVPPGTTHATAVAGAARRLEAYRRELEGRRDRLEVDHLAMGIPPMTVPDLLDRFSASPVGSADDSAPSNARLAHIGRRIAKFVLLGLAGGGKSTAVEQLAAEWARDRTAPIPVLVRCHRLLGVLRTNDAVGLSDIVALAEHVSGDLVDPLVARLMDGRAALVVDGLDECRNKIGRAVEVLRSIQEDLHENTGLVVSARSAVEGITGTLRLPAYRLATPHDLAGTAHEIFEHAASWSGDDDLLAKRRWLRQSQEEYLDVWEVPLIAALLAVGAATGPTRSLPTNRSTAIELAIRRSVERWEADKAEHPDAWHSTLTSQMLLRGFAVLGHLVVQPAGGATSATAVLAADLATDWGVPAGELTKTSEDVLHWWVGRVGAFVDDEDALRARVRMMGEIGDAMWASGLPPPRRAAWIGTCLQDLQERRESVLLAAGLIPGFVAELLDSDETPAVASLAAEAIAQGASVDESTLERLCQLLRRQILTPPSPADHPPEPSKGIEGLKRRRPADPVWDSVLEYAALPLPPVLRADRHALINDLEEQRRAVAAAIAAGSEIDFDARSPVDSEIEAFHAVLDLEPPPEAPDRPALSDGRTFVLDSSTRPPILKGRPRATAIAIRQVGLTLEQAKSASRVAAQSPVSEGSHLISAIGDAGFGDLAGEATGLSMVMKTAGDMARTFLDRAGERALLACIADQDAAPLRSPAEHAWRLETLREVFGALDVPDTHSEVIQNAAERAPADFATLVAIAFRACDAEPGRLRAEASLASALFDERPLDTGVLLHDNLAGATVRPMSVMALASDQEVLERCILDPNSWLFETAANWLDRAGQVERLWELLPSMAPAHRLLAGPVLARRTGRERMAADWLNGPDRILRIAGAELIAEGPCTDDELSQLAGSDDMAVRYTVVHALSDADDERLDIVLDTALTAVPSSWTCTVCGALCVEVATCPACSIGRRPKLREAVTIARRRT
jgi:hypothetical protein